MNHVVAYELLSCELATYREMGYVQLRQLIGEQSSFRRCAGDGVEYEITVIVRWRQDQEGDIRVIGFVGETGWGGPHDSVDDTIVVGRPTANDA